MIAVPRDRNGEFEPQLIKKYQNTVTQDMEEKSLPIVREYPTGQALARTTFRGGLRSCIYGGHPLSCPKRRAHCKVCCLHSP